jgi:hypothetical protein
MLTGQKSQLCVSLLSINGNHVIFISVPCGQGKFSQKVLLWTFIIQLRALALRFSPSCPLITAASSSMLNRY